MEKQKAKNSRCEGRPVQTRGIGIRLLCQRPPGCCVPFCNIHSIRPAHELIMENPLILFEPNFKDLDRMVQSSRGPFFKSGPRIICLTLEILQKPSLLQKERGNHPSIWLNRQEKNMCNKFSSSWRQRGQTEGRRQLFGSLLCMIK